MATSAVASLTAMGVLATSMPRLMLLAVLTRSLAGIKPRSVQAGMSILSYPAPLWHMYFRLFGSAWIISLLNGPVIYMGVSILCVQTIGLLDLPLWSRCSCIWLLHLCIHRCGTWTGSRPGSRQGTPTKPYEPGDMDGMNLYMVVFTCKFRKDPHSSHS